MKIYKIDELVFLILLLLLFYIYSFTYRIKFKVLLFTLYFPVSKHHHSIETYIDLAEKYFNIVKSEVVFYTDKRLKYIVPKNKNIYPYYFDNVTSIPIIKKLNIDNMVKNKAYQIYHSKIALLYYISTKYKANIYFFNDITTFHFRCLQDVKLYPNEKYIKTIFGLANKPILFTIRPNRYARSFIQGGCFGGKKDAITYMYKIYYSFLYQYYKKHGIIRKTEEEILNKMVERIEDAILIPNNPNNCSLYRNYTIQWFYYINVLSGNPKKCVKNLKINHLSDY